MAEPRQLDIKYEFVKPPGYKFKLGAKERPGGQFVVHLILNGGQVNLKFLGEGTQPYEAKQETASKAKEFLYGGPIPKNVDR